MSLSMTGEADGGQGTGVKLLIWLNRTKVWRAPGVVFFHHNLYGFPYKPLKGFVQLHVTQIAQAFGAFFDRGAVHLRHASGGCVGTRGIGKDVEIGNVALRNEGEGVLEHGFRFGGESSNDIAAKHY